MRTRKTLPKARDEDLAIFVVNIGLSPSEYWKLTLREREAIIHQYNFTNKSS